MNLKDKKILSSLVSKYHIHDLIDSLQNVIETQVDELVDTHHGLSDTTKEMSRVAFHLRIFAKHPI